MSQRNRTKIIALQGIDKQKDKDNEPAGQLSIDACRAILRQYGGEYSDEEIALIRKVLYALAEVDYQYHIKLFRKQTTTIISLNTTSADDTEKSHSLLPRQHRRAG